MMNGEFGELFSRIPLFFSPISPFSPINLFFNLPKLLNSYFLSFPSRSALIRVYLRQKNPFLFLFFRFPSFLRLSYFKPLNSYEKSKFAVFHFLGLIRCNENISWSEEVLNESNFHEIKARTLFWGWGSMSGLFAFGRPNENGRTFADSRDEQCFSGNE